MISSQVRARLLATLVDFREILSEQRASPVVDERAPVTSGVFFFTVPRINGYSLGHECLVRAVGIKQLILLESNRNFRVYWLEDCSDIMINYDFHCESRATCRILLQSASSFSAYRHITPLTTSIVDHEAEQCFH